MKWSDTETGNSSLGEAASGRKPSVRKFERGDVRIYADIRESGGGKQRIAVVDLSRSGFRMHCTFLIPEDRTVFLTMPGFASLEARIAWRDSEHYYGCEFRQPLYEAVYDHIVRSFPVLAGHC